MRIVAIAALLLPVISLGACASQPTVVRDRPTPVSVAVIQKCAGEKPAPVAPMRDRIDAAAWEALSLKQKAQTAAAQGLRRMNYGDELGAATSAC